MITTLASTTLKMVAEQLKKLQAYADGTMSLDAADLASTISDMCAHATGDLSPSESLLAFDILNALYPRTEIHIRRIVSEKLAARDDIPRELVLLLANDRIEIARRAIADSPLLQDEDLIRVIVERSHDHRIAVAGRPDVSERVSDVLVYVGDSDVLVQLVKNPGARLSSHAMKRLVIVSRSIEALQEPLVSRQEMHADLASLMYHWVGAALQEHISSTFGADVGERVRKDIAQATAEALREYGATRDTVDLQTESAADSAMPATCGPLVRALRRGDMRGVESEMARLSRLPAAAANRILYNDNGEALAVVTKSAGIGRTLFSELFTRLHGMPPYNAFARSREHASAVAYFMRLTAPQADIILDGWRSNPDGVWGNPNRFNAAWELRKRQP